MISSMDTTSSIISGLLIGSILNVIISDRSDQKIQSCIDNHTFSNTYGNRDFVQCMKGHFPERFADAYKRKLEADAKLTEVDIPSQ